DDVRAHLEHFVRTRVGVEAFLEPPTTVTPPTVLLVATDGEWTRRRVPDPKIVRGLAERLAVPVYDVRLVGYPKRSRAWSDRNRLEGRRDREGAAHPPERTALEDGDVRGARAGDGQRVLRAADRLVGGDRHVCAGAQARQFGNGRARLLGVLQAARRLVERG